MTFPTGFLIGPYKVVRELGRGGIGVVYEVEYVRLGADGRRTDLDGSRRPVRHS